MATPSERAIHARIAANLRWAKEPNRLGATAAARANGPGSIEYWMKKVDPEGRMSREDRLKCADNAKKAHFEALTLKMRKAKAAKAAGEAA